MQNLFQNIFFENHLKLSYNLIKKNTNIIHLYNLIYCIMHFLKTNCLFTQTKEKMKMWNDVLMTQKIVLLIIWFGTYLIDRIHVLQFSRSSTLYGKQNAYHLIGLIAFLKATQLKYLAGRRTRLQRIPCIAWLYCVTTNSSLSHTCTERESNVILLSHKWDLTIFLQLQHPEFFCRLGMRSSAVHAWPYLASKSWEISR